VMPSSLSDRLPKHMIELSLPRITRNALILGGVGVLVTYAGWGLRPAGGFLIGAGISVLSIRSWFRFSEMIAGQGARPGMLSALLLVLRYSLIAVAAYVTINVLGSSPVAMIIGLLVAFGAVVVDLLSGFKGSK
jgi:hypothetical protein